MIQNFSIHETILFVLKFINLYIALKYLTKVKFNMP